MHPKNHLAGQTSPYLLQHVHNPVDWHPWNAEALELAKQLNRPIFLSVGYSTCYWCHVMERECFENEPIAALMNELFVNIKVDREERPDVDQLYMTALQMMSGQGGWPMSVFLTPDLRPFFAGTYFPPQDAYGRPGFPRILQAVADAWTNRRPEIERAATNATAGLRQLAEPRGVEEPLVIDDAWIDSLIRRSTADFDPDHGGFGSAPKFPRETLLELLLARLADKPDAELQSQLRKTLDAMAHGGIRDHLGGGFHRYSTDAQWLVPHFEIMLYDNAMLAGIYAEAYRQWRDPRDAAVARGILDFVLEEMTGKSGNFFTALDAEVDGREGDSYLWTREQVEQALAGSTEPEEIARFCRVYGLDQGPNFADPHHGDGVPERGVLFLSDPGPAGHPNILDESLRRICRRLYEVRRKRKQPRLDDKILTSWNALMIRAMATAGRILNEPQYTQAASRAADYLLSRHRGANGEVLRTPSFPSSGTPGEGEGGGSSRNSRSESPPPRPSPGVPEEGAGFLDDITYLIQALLALSRRDATAGLLPQLLERFGGNGNTGGFFFSGADAPDLIVRQKIASDSPLPSGNAVASMVLLELGHVERAAATIRVFAGPLDRAGEEMSAMVQAAMKYVKAHGPLHVCQRQPNHRIRRLPPRRLRR